jgi:predicted DNA-binding protein (MmcQ/YjbR family)
MSSAKRSATEHEDRRLTALSKLCLALPESTRETSGSHASFLVRKKTFVYFLNNHHGDGIVSVCCRVLPGDNTVLASTQPERFYLPAYIAHRGWVALRLDVGKVDWDEVKELVVGSYCLVAPKSLGAGVMKAHVGAATDGDDG